MKRGAFVSRLQEAFDSRRARNPKYSLRSFAKFLGVDHSSLGQMLRGERPVAPAAIRKFATKLDLAPEEISAYVAASHVPGDDVLARQHHLRHWTAEAVAVICDRVHFEICVISRRPDFRADVRWISSETGASPDEVNVALQRLLRLGLLRMRGERWHSMAFENERQFRMKALQRIGALGAKHEPRP